MKTVNINGKEYVEVNERLKAFRSEPKFQNWGIETEMVEMTADTCTIKAIIKDFDGSIRATGYAREERGASPINRTSYVENCETSAIGRALGCLGIGIDTSICSAEELSSALSAQDKDKAASELKALVRKLGLNAKEIATKYDLNKDSSAEDYIRATEDIINANKE